MGRVAILQGGNSMGKTLNLCECLLQMGRDWQSCGRWVEASRVLQRLSSFRDQPAAIAEETHARLGTIFLLIRDFKKARRHLTAVLFFRPSHAPYYYQLASAMHNDDAVDPARAVRYYRQALRLDPDQPRWWADLGRLYLQIGKTQKGVVALRKAGRLDPDDPAIIAKLVEGLCLADRGGEARTILREARFRHPRDARFRKLWNDFQFRQVQESQDQTPAAPEPVILPFVRKASISESAQLPGRIVRMDQASKPTPHLPGPAWRPDTKHAE
jgi:tetratricopeptide (TPR) repeat protein